MGLIGQLKARWLVWSVTLRPAGRKLLSLGINRLVNNINRLIAGINRSIINVIDRLINGIIHELMAGGAAALGTRPGPSHSLTSRIMSLINRSMPLSNRLMPY